MDNVTSSAGGLYTTTDITGSIVGVSSTTIGGGIAYIPSEHISSNTTENSPKADSKKHNERRLVGTIRDIHYVSDKYKGKYGSLKEFIKNAEPEEREQFLQDIVAALSTVGLLKGLDSSTKGLLTQEGLLSILVCIEGEAEKAIKELSLSLKALEDANKHTIEVEEDRIFFA